MTSILLEMYGICSYTMLATLPNRLEPAIHYFVVAEIQEQEDLQFFLKRGYTVLGFERKITIYKSFYKDLLNNKIIDLYNKKRKIFIIQGDQDNVAPIKDTIDFSKKNTPCIDLKILEGADHRMKKDGELEKVIEWSKQYLME